MDGDLNIQMRQLNGNSKDNIDNGGNINRTTLGVISVLPQWLDIGLGTTCYSVILEVKKKDGKYYLQDDIIERLKKGK